MRLKFLILATTGLMLLLTLILLPGSHSHSQPLASKRTNAVQSAVIQIPLTTRDLVFSPNNQTVYASVSASAPSHANSLVPINPISGITGTAIPIGPDPGQLGMSTNGQWLYVGLNATHSVKRFNIQSQTQGLEFDLGLGVFGSFNRAGDFAPVPGAPDSIAISLRTEFQHSGVAIYDNGVARTNKTLAHIENDRIEYGGTPDVIYSYNTSTTEYRKLVVDSNGVTIAHTIGNIFRGRDIKFVNGLVYGTEGQIFNPETRTLVGKFPVPATIGDAVAIDPAAARAYILTTVPGTLDKILIAYNLHTFIAVASLALPPVVGQPTSLIVAGAGALAFRDDTRVFLIPISALVPIAPTPLPVPTVNLNGVVKLSLATQDLIFDPGTQKIYASLPSRAGTFGNSLAPIDAISGNVGTPVFVGSEPSLLAISDNNQYVYAALDGGGAIRRFNLASQTAGLEFSLGAASGGGPTYATDMEVQPGNPGVLVVSRRDHPTQINAGTFQGVKAFGDGLLKPNAPEIFRRSYVMEFSESPSVLYGLGEGPFNGTLFKFAVDDSGITDLAQFFRALEGTGDFAYANGRIYGRNGEVIDAETQTLIGTFATFGGPMVVDAAAGRVYFLEIQGQTLIAFDIQTFLPLAYLNVPFNNQPTSLIRCGANQLAFRTDGDEVFIVPIPSLQPFPNSQVGITTRADGIKVVSLPANDIAYNPLDQKIYASVPSYAGNIGNSIISFNPQSGVLDSPIFVGSEPSILAVSDTGDTVYAGLDGAAAVRRMTARVPGMQFDLGRVSLSGRRYTTDLAVVPGDPNRVVVATHRLGFISSDAGVVLFNNGVAAPLETAGNSIAFSGSDLYTHSSTSSEFGTRKVAVSSEGLTQVTLTRGLIDGFFSKIAAAGEFLYGSDGTVAQTNPMGAAGRCQTGQVPGLVAPDPANNRIYYLSLDLSLAGQFKSVILTACDLQRFTRVGMVTLPNIFSDRGTLFRFIRYGANGLAFVTSEGKIILATTDIIQPDPPTPLPTPVQVTNEVKRLSLRVGDLVYNKLDGMIYAGLASFPDVPPGSGGVPISYGNSIVAINPETATIVGQPIFVGSEPRKLRISGDSRFIYAGLGGATAISRFDLATKSLGLNFQLAPNPTEFPFFADDFEVAPSAANTVAVSHGSGVAIYDNGVRRPQSTAGFSTNSIEYGALSSILYGFNFNPFWEWRQFNVNSNGVTQISAISRAAENFGIDMKFHNGLVYTPTGLVFNPGTGQVVGAFAATGAVVPESLTRRVYFLSEGPGGNSAVIRAFDMDTFALVGSVTIPGVPRIPSSFIRWGSDGFAFKSGFTHQPGDQLFIVRSSLIPPAPAANPIDDTRAFVRQHYLDFLAREPDSGGWDYWSSRISDCATNQVCIHQRRIDVSAAFFVELEFQRTGYVVYRMHRAAFGTWPGTTTRANISFTQFVADRPLLPEGADLAQSTTNFANAFVGRPEFLTAYPQNHSPTEFVNKLFDTAGLIPYAAERQQQIDAMTNSGKTRAQVLLDVMEIQEFKTREFNRSFVLMQYFGYLGRDPDQAGYDFWLNILDNREPNNYRSMVCAFITSPEYQRRFGSVVTRSNSDCAQ